MKTKYDEIFKTLVKAQEKDSLESTIDIILQVYQINKIELCKIISAFCGVSVTYSSNYIKELKDAIKGYKKSNKIVEKAIQCGIECSSGGEGFCERACPFDAIVNDGKTTSIDYLKCTDCGLCIEACPKGNILDKIQYIPLANILKENKENVIAIVAPAIVGQFGESVSLEQLRAAFIRMGFLDMVEVAFFADLLTLKEAIEFDEHIQTKDDLVITSCCCPMWVAMIKRLYKHLSRYVTPSISPMIAAGRMLKEMKEGCKIVFIGPCVAKKAEAKMEDVKDAVDYVLTFEEVKNIFSALDIIPSKLEPIESEEYASKLGRTYGYTGGVSHAVGEVVKYLFPEKYKMYSPFQADGVKECKEILNKTESELQQYNFIEGMGCIGGCVGGPKVLIDHYEGKNALVKIGEQSKVIVPNESDYAMKVLGKFGIESIGDFKDKSKTEIFHRDFS